MFDDPSLGPIAASVCTLAALGLVVSITALMVTGVLDRLDARRDARRAVRTIDWADQ